MNATDLTLMQSVVAGPADADIVACEARRDVVVTALRARLAVEVAGTLVEGAYRHTRVWAREGGTWRVVGGHVSAVPTA